MKINCSSIVNVNHIGKENTPVVVIDDFFDETDSLKLSAGPIESFSRQSSDYYPGVRKALGEDYQDCVKQWMQTQLPNYINVMPISRISVILSALSLTCDEPNTLLPIQRIPHFDSTNPNQWAVVHYLCDEQFGGTGFFKHKRSDYEVINPANQKSYFRMLDDDASISGVPDAAYLKGTNNLFEMLFKVDAKPNRAVVYPSNLLHSGLIQQWRLVEPFQGRLTANTFCILERD